MGKNAKYRKSGFDLAPHTQEPDTAFFDNGVFAFAIGAITFADGTVNDFAELGLVQAEGVKRLADGADRSVLDLESGRRMAA